LVITIIYQFEPKKKYVKELVDTDESDATSVNEESEKENEHHTEGEEDDE
jgi:hypothetical protein